MPSINVQGWWMYDRVSNHPDFVGIILILLENPESRHNLSQDRKNPDFEDLLPRAMSPEIYFRQILIILVIREVKVAVIKKKLQEISNKIDYQAFLAALCKISVGLVAFPGTMKIADARFPDLGRSIGWTLWYDNSWI